MFTITEAYPVPNSPYGLCGSKATLSTNHNLFEEKGEPKQYRTEVLPLTNLTPYRWAKPAHIGLCYNTGSLYQ